MKAARIWAGGVVAALLMVGCGQAMPGTGQPSTTPTPKSATPAQLTDLGAQIFPYVPQFQIYTTCINFKENGAEPPGGHDYSACPITDKLRARLQATQANFCPCDQNPSTTREIKVISRPGGGLIIVLLYVGQIKVEMVAVNKGGKLLVNGLPGKGDVENGTSTPIDFDPNPTPTPTAPPLPTAPAGTGSRVLNVPWYHQVYVLSCESASLRMALAYEGIATTDKAVLDIMGADLRGPVFDSAGMHWGDPFETFVGNVGGSEVALTGYGTYYPTIEHAATKLGGRVLRSGQNILPAEVYDAVLNGHPVVAWVTYHWVRLARKDYVAFDGKTVPYAGPGEHAVTVVGVQPTRVLINNPSTGVEWIDKPTFEAIYAIYDHMAVILT
jgi:uncharacterized protein YvpB